MAIKFGEKVVDWDVYGHPVGVHYKGSDTYKTKLGAFCTLVAYALMFFNLTVLIVAYMDESKRDEKYLESLLDRFKSDKFNFQDQNMELTLFN